MTVRIERGTLSGFLPAREPLPRTMQRYLAEAIGTFALVFAGTGAVIVNDQTGGAVTLVGISITFALIVAAMIYSLGDLSGAHINPAVTVAMVVAKCFPLREAVPYIAAQSVGALLASTTLRFLYPSAKSLGPTLPAGPIEQAFVLETLLTFLLVFVVFNTTLDTKPENHLAGFVIGGTVGVEVFVGGPITGASMNPARSLGPAIVGGQLEHLWIYLTAPILGGVLAAVTTKYLRCECHATSD